MKGRFRRSMAWLHVWAGLVVGWVLFAMCVTGTASYYRAEISRWMRPELVRAEPMEPAALAAAAEHAVRHLRAHAPEARSWIIGLPQPGKPVLDLFWRGRPGEPPGHVLLDPGTGAEATLRDTLGGDFPYLFHFELHLPAPWGRWAAGLCAMTMLVALLSGIVTHRRLVADFFTFRPDKAPRRSWLDAHNVAGVLALPCHLMIAYTGLVALATLYMPWGVTSAYRGDTRAFFAEAGWTTTPRRPAGRPAALTPAGPLVLRAVAAMPGRPERLSVVNHGDANATVVVQFETPRGLGREHPQIAFDGASGAVLEVTGGDLKPAAKTLTTMVALHEAHFAGPALRVLFFLCGMMACAMIATGLVLWTLARAPRAGEAPGFGLRLVHALNVGAIAGLPAALAAYLLANRLLPPCLAGRADWEVRAFFAAWLATALWPLARPARRAWIEMLPAVSALFCAAAAADVLTVAGHPLAGGGGADPALFLWFDAAFLMLAALFAFASRRIAIHVPTRRAVAH